MFGRLRYVSILLLNAVIALIGPAIVVSPFAHLFRPNSINQIVLRTYFLDAVGALLLGYLIYSVWQPEPAKWVWLIGTCFVAYKGSLVVIHGQSRLRSAFSGTECRGGLMAAGCQVWLHFTIPALHLAAYSLGALLCARLSSKEAPLLLNAYLGRFKGINYDPADPSATNPGTEDKGTEDKGDKGTRR